MSFPKTFLKIPIGWQKRGEVGSESISKDRITYIAHNRCQTRACIGRENDEAFLYCPKCLIKI